MPVRNEENVGELKEIEFMPSTLETIDHAMYKWLDETLNLYATTNKGWTKAPIVWVSAERAYQIKNNKGLRDSKGVLKLPIITVERTSITKDPSMLGRLTAHLPGVDDARGGSITIARRIQQEKTSNFAAADRARKAGGSTYGQAADSSGLGQHYFPGKNTKVVYENISIPLPVYVNVSYTISLRAEYQQQINELLTPFLTKSGQINEFFIKYDGHQFEGFLPKDFGANNNMQDLGEDERMFETKLDIRVLGHLIGEGNNQEKPKIVIRENTVKFLFPRERVVIGDEHPDTGGNSLASRIDKFYRDQ